MKQFLLTITLTLTAAITTFGQKGFDFFSFDDTTGLKCLYIDTIVYSQNIWQIGKPQKTIFTYAYSVPNAIVTDTLNSYPINDTSSFIIAHIVHYPEGNSGNTIVGRYFVNSDTLSDYGTIAYSLNNGQWINLDTVTPAWWTPDLPVLTGNSNGWKDFHFCFWDGVIHNGDTLRYRFMFYSDNIQTNKDGLMFDDLYFDDISEGIEEPCCNLISSKAFPNPAYDNLNVGFENKNNSTYKLALLDNMGKIVKTLPDIKSNTVKVNIKELSSGIYYYKLTNTFDKKYAIGRFLKQ
ncbi:MAG: T9SS type A sorting domain-containing protein [Bacteroidetes bacterium]|nr:T9SS type A sorting domain-containing protein [Bacteroidota bacterium]